MTKSIGVKLAKEHREDGWYFLINIENKPTKQVGPCRSEEEVDRMAQDFIEIMRGYTLQVAAVTPAARTVH